MITLGEVEYSEAKEESSKRRANWCQEETTKMKNNMKIVMNEAVRY